jgi:ABC-type Zn uptake system ZnuABC Zn-binding protein ZnuA
MVAGFLGLLLAACAALASPAWATVRVLATTTDLAALASAVGGDLVTVESFVPPGADPEAFQPRPRDGERLRQADVLIRVGLGYDYWLDALLARYGGGRMAPGADAYVDASKGIPLLEIRGESVVSEGGHAHGVANPHYWLDPENASIVTAAIVDALVRVAPQSRDRWVANREQFLQEVKQREMQWLEIMRPFAGARVIAYHNSWPYFARRFHIDVIDFIEPKPGVAPTPARLAQLIGAGRRAEVRAVLHEPYQPEDSSQLVAQRLGVPLLHLALSVGSVREATTYIALIDHNVSVLAGALHAAPR